MTKQEEILLAAEEEFFMNGYNATSTATIAHKAGVTHAMVNYYFKNKEKLFIKILDNHVYELLESIKPLMLEEGNAAGVAIAAAEAIFDKMNKNRRFPFLLSDISRTHPDFLLRYREDFETVCRDSIRKHVERLGKCIENGEVRPCTMNDIYCSILMLSTAPFISIPLLENVACMSSSRIDEFLMDRKKEMTRILRARYV